MAAGVRAQLGWLRRDVGRDPRSGQDRASMPLSYWHDSLESGDAHEQRPALQSDVDADVAIVGAGFTGLWTAYYPVAIRSASPSRRGRTAVRRVRGIRSKRRWCAARWLCEEKGAMVIGSDTSTLEVVPAVDGAAVAPVHEYPLVQQGVHIGELHYLEQSRRQASTSSATSP
jgi:hypothetical protein